MTERTRGIVLRKVRYGDTGLIVDIFTEARGTVAFLARTGRTGRTRAQALAPLALVEVAFRWRPQQSLQRLDEVQVARPYTTLDLDPVKASVALYVQELLYHALKHEVASEGLYRYVVEGLEWLDTHHEGLANFHLAFTLRLIWHLGLWPRVEGWHEGYMFDLKEGEMTDRKPTHPYWLTASDTERLPQISRMTLRNMRLYRMSRMQRNVILDALLAYYRLHVPEFPTLKSVEMLREVFA